MARRLSILGCALACSVLANACMHDFSGYHLGSGDAAGGGAVASAGGAALGGASSSDAGAEPGAVEAGAPSQAGAASEAGAQSVAGSKGGSGAPNAGAAGSPADPPKIAPPSCLGLPNTCGPGGAASCCAASIVGGGTYDRSNLPAAPATVSAFMLDDYEVTVGRFRTFIAAYTQDMTPAGSGKNPHDLGANPGWNTLWNARIPATAAALSSAVQCPSTTYTAAAGSNENKAMTCVSWYEAYAFCIWDGARLPTEAEWNFAAAGGTEERVYPWGELAPDDAHAVFCPGSCSTVLAVGAKSPSGNGKFGQADLVGNVWEWNLDVYANPYPKAACNDCGNAPADSTSPRVFRGGSAGNDAGYLLGASRYSRPPADHNGFVGLRCARNL